MKPLGFRKHGTRALLRYAGQMPSSRPAITIVSNPVFSKRLLVSALGVQVLLLMSPTQAQAFKPSCVETLRVNPNAFAQTYVQKTQDSSELGYDMAALYWAKCKATSNNKRLERVPQIKAKILRIREIEGKLVNAEADLASQRAGNSAVYSHARARAQASLELHIGRLIAIAISPTGVIASRSVTREHQAALAQFDVRLQKLRQPAGGAARSLNRNKWAGSVKSYSSIWAALRTMISTSNVFSLEVARFVAKGFFL
jgi:hypothetical protein